MISDTYATPIRFNKREITLPFFVVGTEDFDLPGTLKAMQRAIKAQ